MAGVDARKVLRKLISVDPATCRRTPRFRYAGTALTSTFALSAGQLPATAPDPSQVPKRWIAATRASSKRSGSVRDGDLRRASDGPHAGHGRRQASERDRGVEA